MFDYERCLNNTEKSGQVNGKCGMQERGNKTRAYH